MVESLKLGEFTLGELASYIGAELRGDSSCKIAGLGTLQGAGPGQLSFFANPAYRRYLTTTKASGVVIRPDAIDQFEGNALIHENPYLGFAKLTALFETNERKLAGVHPTAIIAETADISPSASIGPYVVIEDGVHIGKDTEVGAGCFIGQHSVIGDDCRIAPKVSIYHGVNVGNSCIIHSSAVIGADGFGFAVAEHGWVKVHQLGGVDIGNRVEIGAGTTIDRGALDNTCIADGVIIDNQVQIAHNVTIGKNTAIAGCAAIAGSTSIGANCAIAGGAGIIGHLTITDNVSVTAMSLVTKSIRKSGSYSSGTPISQTPSWRKNAVRFNQLDGLVTRIKQLEKYNSDNN